IVPPYPAPPAALGLHHDWRARASRGDRAAGRALALCRRGRGGPGVGARVPRRRAPSLELDAQFASWPLLGLARRLGARESGRAGGLPRPGAGARPGPRAQVPAPWRAARQTGRRHAPRPRVHRRRDAHGQRHAARRHRDRGHPRQAPASRRALWTGARGRSLRRIPLRHELRLAHVWTRAAGQHPRNGDAPMDLLTTILTCSLYVSDDALVRAIAEGPSGKNPYLVLDPVADSAEAGAPPSPKSEAEGAARAQGLMAQGGRPLLGLLELLPAWLDLFGRPP